jgi:hypothetical protein
VLVDRLRPRSSVPAAAAEHEAPHLGVHEADVQTDTEAQGTWAQPTLGSHGRDELARLGQATVSLFRQSS